MPAYGVSVESVEEGLICLNYPGVQALQVIFNLFRQKPLAELFPKAHAQGVGILVRLPLASGLLTGKFTADTKFEPDDHRNFNRNGEASMSAKRSQACRSRKALSLPMRCVGSRTVAARWRVRRS